MAGQIGVGDLAFGEAGVAASASRGQDARSEILKIKEQRVVEAGFENRRRPAAIFRRAEDDDDVGGAGFIDRGLAPDFAGQRKLPEVPRAAKARTPIPATAVSRGRFMRYAGRSEPL